MRRDELTLRAEALHAQRAAFVDALVVRAQRPTSVRPGDRAIVHPDGTIEGFVGGACAEASVRLHSLRVLETGDPLILRIVPGDSDAIGEEGAAAEGAVTVRNPCLSGGALEIFLEPRLPAPRIVVVGSAPVAAALTELGRDLGYEMVSGHEDEIPLDGDVAAVVVASHGRGEERALTRALEQDVAYVGLIASRRRGAAVLGALDVPEELRARVRTPAGLEIGARTPKEIALSVLAEIVALRHRVDVPRSAGRGEGELPRAREGSAASRSQAGPVVAVDPVCGMEVVVGPGPVYLDHGGERFYFCGPGCRERMVSEIVHHADLT